VSADLSATAMVSIDTCATTLWSTSTSMKCAVQFTVPTSALTATLTISEVVAERLIGFRFVVRYYYY
jgi:hypothetical protein